MMDGQSRFRWLLFLAFCLSACGAQLAPAPTSPPATPLPATAVLTVAPTPQPTATAKFIPKANDLTFIEFFAVT